MLKMKLCVALASAAMLASVPVKADDNGTITLVKGGSGTLVLTATASTVDAGPAEAHDVMFERGEYWLGVLVSRPSEALQAQLILPKDQGLLVESVQPKSPAAKAGIQQHDILLEANNKPLGTLRDLMKLINEVKEGKLTFDLLRSGKHETVAATLVKRPADEQVESFNVETPLRFKIIGPGQILPSGPEAWTPGVAAGKVDATIRVKATLSDGSQAEYTREGDKVVVTHDKERWEGTSKDLSKIPAKIRPEVEASMEHLSLFTSPTGPAHSNTIYFSGAVLPPGMPGTIAIGPNMDARLAEMHKQIEELQKQVKALQEGAKKKE